MHLKITLLALCLGVAPSFTLPAFALPTPANCRAAAPAVPILYQAAKSNAHWNGAMMIPLFDEPVDFSAITSDPVFATGILFSGQKYESKRIFNRDQKIPTYLDGREFYLLSIDAEHTFECAKAGDIIGIAFSSDSEALLSLKEQGFDKKDTLPLAYQTEKFPGSTVAVHTRSIDPGEKIVMPKRTILAGITVPCTTTGEVLYNNIVLPKQWPPKRDPRSDEPPEIPYLKIRPKVVPIDIGRQLFIDDFLIEKTSLTREFHRPEKYKGNPVLNPETELEKKSRFGDCAVAAPLGGSIWWNPDKQLFEIWYEAGHLTNLAYATSKDGLKWERPSLNVFPGTNKTIEQAPDSWSVVYDFWETDPQQKYKLLVRPPNLDDNRVRIYTSPDGVHWNDHGLGGHCGDRTTFFYNPFRKKWVFSLRWGIPGISRVRGYIEADDFVQGSKWTPSAPVLWARPDKLDKHYDDGIPENDTHPVMLYNLDACAYESVLISFFQLFYGPENSYWATRGIPKLTALNFAYSRDGFNWDRPDRSLAIKPTQNFGDWDCGYVQSVGNLMAVRGDKLLIYYTAFAGDTSYKWDPNAASGIMPSGMHQNGAMGVAVLRRDGFSSMNAHAQTAGMLTTRPIIFSGKNLFVNVDAPKGELLAQVVGVDGNPIAPFTFENCEGVRGDTTISQMEWKSGSDLSALAGKPVRFEFKLKQGKLYAFWVSRDESGRSDGYVAGGGPGFTSNVDTQGKNAYVPNVGISEQLNK